MSEEATEPRLLFLRQTEPNELPELVVSLDEKTYRVFVVRPTLLRRLAIDSVRLALQHKS
jgi:hypothetical protein